MSAQMGLVGGARRGVDPRADLAPARHPVNSLGPTFLLTPMTAPVFANPEFRAKTLACIPLGRVGAVEDLMGAILSWPPTPPPR
jgi:NAD(P)-dependent dehydrogenase (short-subunit alcohol dehydrogenase family)